MSPPSRPPELELLHALEGHATGVLSVAFTRNGRYVMTASQDKSLKLWNPHRGLHVKTYVGPHNQEVYDVVVTADNSKFASCGGDKHVFLWDVTTAQVIRSFAGHDRKVNALALGPNDDVLLSASTDRTVRIWDLRTRTRSPIQSLAEATDSMLCVHVAGDEILTGSVDGGLRHYDVRKGELVMDQLSHPIGSISLSHDSQCILVSMLDNTVCLLERETGDELARYKGHANKRFKVQSCLDPTDAYVFSGSEDNRVCFWEIVEAELVGHLEGHGAPVLCIEFYEDTLVTAAADGSVKVWKVRGPCATR